MRQSIKSSGQIYVKGYGFLSFAKNIGKNLSINMDKRADALKTASERGIHKTEETTGELFGNKIADKIYRNALQFK